MRHPRAFLSLSFGVLLVLGVSSCATLQQIAALRNVEFSLDRVSDLRLAGIDLGRIHSIEDLGILDAGRLALAESQKRLPLDFRLHLSAENPASNTISARLVQMDWTLLLQDRETLSGVFDGDVLLPPGQPTDVPITISLNLVDFFEGSAQDLLELALSLAGQGGAPKDVALRATPVIETPLGPMRYPQPITILSRKGAVVFLMSGPLTKTFGLGCAGHPTSTSAPSLRVDSYKASMTFMFRAASSAV